MTLAACLSFFQIFWVLVDDREFQIRLQYPPLHCTRVFSVLESIKRHARLIPPVSRFPRV